jgi:hypothetical protein
MRLNSFRITVTTPTIRTATASITSLYMDRHQMLTEAIMVTSLTKELSIRIGYREVVASTLVKCRRS